VIREVVMADVRSTDMRARRNDDGGMGVGLSGGGVKWRTDARRGDISLVPFAEMGLPPGIQKTLPSDWLGYLRKCLDGKSIGPPQASQRCMEALLQVFSIRYR
jgi:hypothetical protein